MKYVLVIASVIIALALLHSAAYAAPQSFKYAGKVTGVQNQTVTKTLAMGTNDELALILQASGGNFGSKFMIVQGSYDCNTYLTLDNISLSTNTIKAVQYSDANKATTVPVNPADFPCVKAFSSAGVTGVTESLTYAAKP